MTNTNNCNYTLKSFERNNYFYGKLMTVRDFQLQSDFHAGQLQLVNRLVHGVGVVCGLEINPAIETKINVKIGNDILFTIAPGVALDCCGKEIIIPEKYQGDIAAIKDYDAQPKLYIYLKHKEEDFENVPVGGGSSCGNDSCCPNRTRETFSIVVSKDGPTGCSEFELDKQWENEGGLPEFQSEINSLKGEINEILSADWREIEAKTLVAIKELMKNTCPECKSEDGRVLLAVVTNQNGTIAVNDNETIKYRNLVLSNPLLYELINTHMHDMDNPHKVTAVQVNALKTINNIGNNAGSNYISNINLQSPSGDNTIDISPQPTTTPGINISTITFKLKDDAVLSKHIKEADATSPADTIHGTGIATGHIRDKAITPDKLSFFAIQNINGSKPKDKAGNITLTSSDNSITITITPSGDVIDLKAVVGNLNTVPLYRAYNPKTGDHFYTVDLNEYQNATGKLGYTAEGISCYVFPPRKFIIPKDITDPVMKAIIAHIPDNTPVSTAQLASIMNIDKNLIQDNLTTLVNKKLITKQGNSYINTPNG